MTVTRRPGQFTNSDPTSELLVALASGHRPDERAKVTPRVIELAQRHGLVALLAGEVDDPLVRAIQAREGARRAVLERHLEKVLVTLDDSDIPATVLKGPAIASRYQNPDLRPFSDIDLLVPADRVEQALDVLAGYPGTASIPAKRPKADKRDIVLHDDSGMRFNVDLHWDLFSYTQLRRSAEGATEAAWAAAVPDKQSALGPTWQIPDSFRIAFLASHSVLDHRFRLILFRDLLELTAGEVDWEGLDRVSQKWGLRSTTYLALWLSKEMLGARIDASFLTSLRPGSLPLRYLESALPRVDMVRFDGHRPHPVNLASVLLNDSPLERLSLLVRAPGAFPAWRRRVSAESTGDRYPRTLMVVSSDRRRGAEVFTERLSNQLVRRGWVVEAVALRGASEGARVDVEALTTERALSRFNWRVLRALWRKVRSFNPDVIVANGGSTLRYSLVAALARNTRVAYISIGEPDYWIRSSLSKWANRFMLRKADLILAVSDATRRQTIQLEPRVENRIHTTWTGLPAEMFRVQGGGSEGPLRVLVIGSLSEEKDPGMALTAASHLPDARIRFVGDGPLRARLIRQADRLGASARAEFVGAVDDVAPHLEWANVLLLTSKSEGLPGALLEASAAGIPTVAVDVGGVSEAVVDGEGGFITGREVDEVAAALRKLEADREMLRRMGEKARSTARERFAMDEVVDRYARLLSGITS